MVQLLSEGIPSPFLLTFFQVYVRLSQCSCFYVGKIYFCVCVLYFIGMEKVLCGIVNRKFVKLVVTNRNVKLMFSMSKNLPALLK